MKVEIINSIAREINRQNRAFKEQVVMKELNENGVLFDLYRFYKEKLFPRTGKEEFASLYSQTVIFVLLSAALFNQNIFFKKDLKGILLNIIKQLNGIDTIVDHILKSIILINVPKQLNTFILESRDKLTGPGESVLKEYNVLEMLYERFLKRYEPTIHKKLRYYYTPAPVVSFMVHSIHNLLKEKLNIYEGLADFDIHILDPAFGTANFLESVIQLAIEEKTKKYGEGIRNPFIESYLSKNIYGFEVMLPLYLSGCIKLLKLIKSFCRGAVRKAQSAERKADTRVTLCAKRHAPSAFPLGNLYLTDTLTIQERPGIVHALKHIGVIFCNPPYSRHSLNKDKWILELVKDYLQVEGKRIEEKNYKGLQDDYVKFLRYSQWLIDQNGSGVMGFITANSYLENLTFRGMRYSLLKSFDEIYILDLHGAARKVDKNDDDENVFGVGQGIAIGFFIKQKRPGKIRENLDSLNCRVFYYGMKGSKASKLKNLEKLKQGNIKDLQWERVFPLEDFYLFTPGRQVDIYRHFIKITDIFPVHSVGIVTARDKLTIKYSEEEMYTTVSNFTKVDESFARKSYKLVDDTRDWQVVEAQRDIKDSDVDRKKIVPILYRPFDLRYTYYTGKSRGFICMPRPEVMRHMLWENIGLVTVRQVPGGIFSHCFVTDTIIESRITTSQKGIAYIFPLYKYIFPDEKGKKFNFNRLFPGESMPRQCNIDPGVFARLHEIFGEGSMPSSSQIFYYIYAILNSNIYRELYREHLKIDFPRIPITSDIELFMQLSSLGEGLAAVHLMKSRELDHTFSKFDVIGENLVKHPLFKPEAGGDGRVYINEIQYFSNIPLELWEQEICGYQVLKKWLLVRKKRRLTPGEILHYIKICRAVQLTARYREEIDVLYSQLEKAL